jgi:sterol desaturase/sphingolipid hydroxylase (fatty acid hydroxylase superfamily)
MALRVIRVKLCYGLIMHLHRLHHALDQYEGITCFRCTPFDCIHIIRGAATKCWDIGVIFRLHKNLAHFF